MKMEDRDRQSGTKSNSLDIPLLKRRTREDKEIRGDLTKKSFHGTVPNVNMQIAIQLRQQHELEKQSLIAWRLTSTFKVERVQLQWKPTCNASRNGVDPDQLYSQLPETSKCYALTCLPACLPLSVMRSCVFTLNDSSCINISYKDLQQAVIPSSIFRSFTKTDNWNEGEKNQSSKMLSSCPREQKHILRF